MRHKIAVTLICLGHVHDLGRLDAAYSQGFAEFADAVASRQLGRRGGLAVTVHVVEVIA